MANSDDLQAGLIVDDAYEIISLLGQGGMGKVYLCEHIVLKNRYALKALNLGEESQVHWLRFQAEARAIAKLSHPNLVKVHNMGIYQKRVPYYVMDLLAGESLRERILREGPLDEAEAIRIFLAVCCGLEHAHQFEIIHRDIKPANIMLSGTEVKLVDFGLVKSVGDMVQKLTATGEILGSPYYMSPEQTSGAPLGYASDLYSIGVSLFEALTGTVPFKGQNAVQTLLMHQSSPVPTLASAAPEGCEFSPAIEKIVTKLLKKDPADRYRSATRLIDDLDKLQAQDTGHADNRVGQALRRLRPQDQGSQHESGSDSSTLEKFSQISLQIKRRNLALVGALVIVILGLATTGATTLLATKGELKTTKIPATKAEPQPKSAPLVPFFSHLEGKNRIFKFPAAITKGRFEFLVKGVPKVATVRDGVLSVPPGVGLVYIAHHDLTDMPYLLKGFGPDDLYCLDLSDCGWNCSKTLQQCQHLTGLQRINLTSTDCDGKSLMVLNKMPRLTDLLLNQTTITPDQVYKLPMFESLRTLEFSNCADASDLLDHLIDHKHLRRLALESSELELDDFKKIARMRHLQELFIPRNIITLENLKVLTKIKTLRELDIRFSDLTPDCLPVLAALPPKTLVRLTEQPSIDVKDARLLAKQIKIETSVPRLTKEERKSVNEEINQASSLIND